MSRFRKRQTCESETGRKDGPPRSRSASGGGSRCFDRGRTEPVWHPGHRSDRTTSFGTPLPCDIGCRFRESLPVSPTGLRRDCRIAAHFQDNARRPSQCYSLLDQEAHTRYDRRKTLDRPAGTHPGIPIGRCQGMKPRKPAVIRLSIVVLLVCISQSLSARTITPVELTTGSILRVDRSGEDRLHLNAVNAPIRAVLEEIAAKGGIPVVWPNTIRGRLTWSAEGRAPLYLLYHVAARCDLNLVVVPKPARLQIIPRVRRTRPARRDPITPKNGIRSGYLIYEGQYVAPPYAVTKSENSPNWWDIHINGLDCLLLDTHPPEGPPIPDKQGQFGSLHDVWRQCCRLWMPREQAGESLEDLKAMLDRFLRTQRIVKEHGWPSKYLLRIETIKGNYNPYVMRFVAYPPDEQLQTEEEIGDHILKVVTELTSQGLAFSREEAEGAAIVALLEQEYVSGPTNLEFAERLQKAKTYYERKLEGPLAFSWRIFPRYGMVEWQTMEGAGKRKAERVRKRLENTLASGGTVLVLPWGKTVCFADTKQRGCEIVQSLVKIVESNVPYDVKVCAAQALVELPTAGHARCIIENFHPTPALKWRLAYDLGKPRTKRQR